ncbi:DUF2889 domain-containing protein [Clostridiaceae bacterium UIB06]|uniref:DUF2889 domain-containing protein n=1 Tax=Clostridium thailandense TaxID=2794346 RepID=A0A949TPP1_9CLOT|nr:DUF2889 domain-containing protein [Clostridium thailandense]MBV7274277.1 DUF2889 domain-containing protein [Clostridium thailandense]MCH5136177.1 DUF2889 domain-containing protein [Clostridiaceae bacterium UIB06]
MKKVSSRNFNVDYFEKEKNIWVVKTQLADEHHEIGMEIEMDMIEMIIKDATIKFNKFPLEHCALIEEKAEKLKGMKVDNEFIKNSMKIFMGAKGCPNVMTLLNISVPGIIYYYYPYKLKTGEMKYEQWDNMIRTDLKDACLAHSML